MAGAFFGHALMLMVMCYLASRAVLLCKLVQWYAHLYTLFAVSVWVKSLLVVERKIQLEIANS